MKEITKDGGFLERVKGSELSAAVFSHAIAGVLGLVCARAVMPGGLVPFGVCITAAAPYEYLPSAATGAFIGYFIPAVESGGFRYIAALLCVLAIRILLSSFKNVTASPAFVCLVPALSLLFTAPVMAKVRPVPALAAEIALSLTAAGVMHVAFRAMTHRKAGFAADELSAFLICVAICLTGIKNISAGSIYLYRVAWVFLVLIAAKYGGPAVSSATGTAAGICCVLAGGGADTGMVFVLLGLVTGVFRTYGKWATCFAGLVSAVAGTAFLSGGFDPGRLAETLIGGALFLSLPRRGVREFGKFLSLYPKLSLQNDITKMVKMKLSDTADALFDVKNTVNEVASRLSLVTAPDFKETVRETENTACGDCRLRIHCWESRRAATSEAMTAVIEAKKKGVPEPEQALPEEFRIRCRRPDAFCSAVLSVYEKYAKSLALEARAKEIRQVVSEQFDGIAVMLRNTANDIDTARRFDKPAALAVAAALKNIDIFATEAACRIDRFGRMSVKIKAVKQNDAVINKRDVLHAIQLSVERDFSVPVITEKGNDVYITLCETPAFRAVTGVCQITASGSSICGDSYRFLSDGFGRFFVILSDGMGTGGAAAVDSALSSALFGRLIKSGVDPDSALKIINSSMLFKSTFESTATVDLACIDLYSGRVEIFKAGAAPTLVKRGSRVGSAVGKTLPIGILSDAAFDKAAIRLKDRDIVLMMSDGATGEGLDWIKRELENCGEATAQSIADNIAAAARRHRSDGHEDDITVIAVILSRTEK